MTLISTPLLNGDLKIPSIITDSKVTQPVEIPGSRPQKNRPGLSADKSHIEIPHSPIRCGKISSRVWSTWHRQGRVQRASDIEAPRDSPVRVGLSVQSPTEVNVRQRSWLQQLTSPLTGPWLTPLYQLWPREVMLEKSIVKSLAAVYLEHIQSCPHPYHLQNSRHLLNQLEPQSQMLL